MSVVIVAVELVTCIGCDGSNVNFTVRFQSPASFLNRSCCGPGAAIFSIIASMALGSICCAAGLAAAFDAVEGCALGFVTSADATPSAATSRTPHQNQREFIDLPPPNEVGGERRGTGTLAKRRGTPQERERPRVWWRER